VSGMSVDRLFETRNAFYIGNYQTCITEAQKSATSDDEKATKKIFLYRAYIAQKKMNIVLSEIPEGTKDVALKAIRRLAEYQNSAKRTKVLSEIESELSSPIKDETYMLLTSSVLLDANKPEDALQVLYECTSLECHAATVQALLRMDRVDLAVKELKKMAEIDEDSTQTQLATAWVNLALGREKLKDAYYIFQEQIDRHGATPLLLVGQSTALILQEKFEEAESLLQDAQTRDSNNADAMINMIVVSAQLGQPSEVVNRLIAQMKDSHPSHPWTRSFVEKEEVLNKIAVESSA
ncbi:cope-1, partial [Pristionchus pacificus]